MPIGSSKLGVLGAGLVPGGTETFNAPGTFSIPPGVKKVSITGKGGAGNPGVAGNPGNPGNLGGGAGGGGGASSIQPGTVGGFAFNASNCFNKTGAPCNFFSLNDVRTGGKAMANSCPAPSANNPSNTPGSAGQQGLGGNAGSVGCAGTAGNAGQSSLALCNTFPGGAGGNAPPGGNAGNAGSGGQGGNGSTRTTTPRFTASCRGNGGNGGGQGGLAYPGPLPCCINAYGGWGGGGASANSDGGSGGGPAPVNNRIRGSGGRDNTCVFPPGFNIYTVQNPSNPGNSSAGKVFRTTDFPSSPFPPNNVTLAANARAYAGGSGSATGPSIFSLNNNCFFVTPATPPGPQIEAPGSNPVVISGQGFAPGPPYSGPNLSNAGGFLTPKNPRPGLTVNSNIFRAGGGGGAGSDGGPTQGAAGGAGGGGRGNAGNAGGPSPTVSGSAANPVTFNCVPVTPGTPTPITVGSPGGQVVISWNPQ
jgi:hypothetical protein